jgi:hypothetical protein
MAVTSFIAGEAISAGNVVYVTTSGFIRKSIGTAQDQASPVGISVDTSSVNNLTRVVSDSIYSESIGLTAGNRQYLSLTTSGAIVDYSTWQTQLNSLSASGAFLTQIGTALSSTAINVEIERPIYITK